MAATADISFYIGEDVMLRVTMDPVEDITGWTLAFMMRKTIGLLPIAISKEGPPDIIIVNAAGGVFTVKIDSDETADLAAGEYQFDIQRVDAGARSVLVRGTITLVPMVNTVSV